MSPGANACRCIADIEIEKRECVEQFAAALMQILGRSIQLADGHRRVGPMRRNRVRLIHPVGVHEVVPGGATDAKTHRVLVDDIEL